MEDFITVKNQEDAEARSHDSLKKQLITLENTYGAKNYHPLDVVIAKGNGIWLWDTNGKKYLDCLSGYSAVNQGHCHPKIVETIVRQSQQLTLTSRAFRNDQLGPFYQELCTLTRSHLALPMNSGSEAVESCIKAVRKWGYTSKGVPDNQAEIIVCDNNFHGRTVTIVGFSSDEGYRKSFGPFTPGFVRIPFGDSKALESAITPNTVAFLVEPIQGEAGIIVPPKGYLKEVREICTRNNVILITDEIQTGLGRTGAMLAEEHEGIEADLTLLGKALSGGFYPVSAVLSNEHVLGVFEPGEHGSTFGGNPLACAIARTAIRLLQEEGMIENAKTLGAYALDALSAITGNKVKEVRGKGLMIGIEMYHELGGARRFSEQLCNAGILCKETHDHTLRFAPPLIITKKELDWALETIISILS